MKKIAEYVAFALVAAVVVASALLAEALIGLVVFAGFAIVAVTPIWLLAAWLPEWVAVAWGTACLLGAVATYRWIDSRLCRQMDAAGHGARA